jgi:hypothetical protein
MGFPPNDTQRQSGNAVAQEPEPLHTGETASASGAGSADEAPRWLRRLSLVIYVAFCIEVGMLLIVLPWTTVWTENSLLLTRPELKAVLQQGFVRGIVTGLGILDLWLGISEAVHYREK